MLGRTFGHDYFLSRRKSLKLRTEDRLQYIASYLVTTHSSPFFSVVTVNSSW